MVMAGVKDKASYGVIRIDMPIKKIEWLQNHFPCGNDLRQAMDAALVWLNARKQSWERHGGVRLIWKYRHFSKIPSIAEIVLKYCPDRVFMMAVTLARKNYI